MTIQQKLEIQARARFEGDTEALDEAREIEAIEKEIQKEDHELSFESDIL